MINNLCEHMNNNKKINDNLEHMQDVAKNIGCTITIEKDYNDDSEIFLLNKLELIVFSAYQVPIMIGFITGIEFALEHGKGKKIMNINDYKLTSF